MKFSAGAVAVDPEVAAVIEQGLTREGEAEAKAILFSEGDEGLEQAIADFGANAGAGVFDGDEDGGIVGARVDMDGPALGHDFDGVFEKIAKDALHAGALHGTFESVGDLGDELHLLGFGIAFDGGPGGDDDIANRAQLGGAGSAARNVEQLLEHFLDSAGSAINICREAANLRSGKIRIE